MSNTDHLALAPQEAHMGSVELPTSPAPTHPELLLLVRDLVTALEGVMDAESLLGKASPSQRTPQLLVNLGMAYSNAGRVIEQAKKVLPPGL